ncbi:MAG: phosphatase PAP2 family protein [Pseudomonadota bacterium]
MGVFILKYFLPLLLISLLSVPTQLFAKGETPVNTSATELRYKLDLDLAVTATASAAWLVTDLLKDDIASSSCKWCGVNSFDSWGHKNLKWSNTGASDTLSAITAIGLSPLIAFGMDAFAANREGRISNFPVDALVISEAAAVSLLLCQIVKFSVGRQRPDAHYDSTLTSPKHNTSFYSGHTSLAFALAVSSGTVATMREYKLAPLIWGAGLAVAATTGYLRIAADKHYITDVIGGALIGSAIGFGIPYLFHRPKPDKGHALMLSAMPIDGGMMLNISGRI